jgi:two-component system sensor histidine kinase YesM
MVSLRRRFNTVFVLLVALPLLVVCLTLSVLYMNALEEIVSSQTQDLLGQVAQNVEKEINTVSVLAATMLYDQALIDAARSWAAASPGPARIGANWRITERLDGIFTITGRVGAIAVYMTDSTVLTVSNYPTIRSFTLADRAAYNQAKANPNQVVIADSLSGMTDNGSQRFILSAIICPDRASRAANGIDAILVMFRLPYLDEFTTMPARNGATGLIIIGQDGKAVLSDFTATLSAADLTAIRQLAPGNDYLALHGKSYLVNSRQLRNPAWTFVLAIDRLALTERLIRYQWYLYPALGLMLGLFLVYAMVFFARVSRPIEQVVANMRRFAAGDDPLPVRREEIRELAALDANFDAMVAEIRRLAQEQRRLSEQRLAAEIQALQFQINPHFVANTLNSIRMMALAARNDAIRDMTQALIRILADSYAIAQPMTVLANEIANVKNYLYIMKVRFGEHFRVEYELAPDTLECRLLRMSLQPLVENAILHGFAGLSRQGVLVIRSRLEAGGLLVEIADNGVGMEAARCRSLLDPPAPPAASGEAAGENFNRIGVYNVHERIRLNFGPDYGLEIESQAGSGTTARLRLPCLREE